METIVEPEVKKPGRMESQDMLQVMFDLQAGLDMRLGLANPEEIREVLMYKMMLAPGAVPVVEKHALQQITALRQEIAELLDCLPWKHWKKNQVFNLHKARKEIVDMFHFTISIALCLGMDAEAIFRGYLAKNQINHQRQDEGY